MTEHEKLEADYLAQIRQLHEENLRYKEALNDALLRIAKGGAGTRTYVKSVLEEAYYSEKQGEVK